MCIIVFIYIWLEGWVNNVGVCEVAVTEFAIARKITARGVSDMLLRIKLIHVNEKAPLLGPLI
ncbi:MAG: hypothetical protein A2932_00135 [Candidatus Spechtbacteria bacterium RIFCSPLOWO2_01_FULL_46_10]|uniref:Uncharacterized protein n=1 Tax=Candidatus Spechtbacteria bacterium RIFCSPLOWO2_01_FULL_46_10 TaxID=1802163 RepID=A0A1G2HG59_9BACT|nr:MAG: hypothetical protein A2932_00135 [Candidatus Spechtbacteria bacterium RIFCSPLOWO2_01_FULL_46_10]